MLYEFRYTQYKDFGGIKFPALVHVHLGNPVLNPAHNIYEIKVNSVNANVNVPEIPVPDEVRQAVESPIRVQAGKLAGGVMLLAGGAHNTVAGEVPEFLAVGQGPPDASRSPAVLYGRDQVYS